MNLRWQVANHVASMADNDIFMSSRWFSPYISSVEMEAKMKGEEYAGKDGVFGVRVSKSNPS